MVLGWTAAGMLNAERSFRRIKGHKQMPQPMTALHRHAPRKPLKTPKLSVPPPKIHRGSSSKFHATRDVLLVAAFAVVVRPAIGGQALTSAPSRFGVSRNASR
jgi:hypothetical protein